MSGQALHETALWMVRNMTRLSHGKEVLFKKDANITIDSERNLAFQMKEKAAVKQHGPYPYTHTLNC